MGGDNVQVLGCGRNEGRRRREGSKEEIPTVTFPYSCFGTTWGWEALAASED